MKIDLSGTPPAGIFQERGRYIRISASLLALVICAVLLAVYAFFLNNYSERLETAALVLFVWAGLLFAYFTEKLQAYKRLTPQQNRELAELSRRHAEIAAYCALVAKAGRLPILAEYEACVDRADELSRGIREKQS